MRRFRIPICIFLGFGLCIVAWDIYSRATDELGFLRRFNPKVECSEVVTMGAIQFEPDGTPHQAGTGLWCTQVTFPEVTPELLETLKKRCEYAGPREIKVQLSGKRSAVFNIDAANMTIFDEANPSWLDIQIDQLRRKLHLEPSLHYAKDR